MTVVWICLQGEKIIWRVRYDSLATRPGGSGNVSRQARLVVVVTVRRGTIVSWPGSHPTEAAQ